MNYYGIVDNITYGSGIYGRDEGRKELKQGKKGVISSLVSSSAISSIISASIIDFETPTFSLISTAIEVFSVYAKKIINRDASSKIKLIDRAPEDDNNKVIIIPNMALKNNYNIEGEELLFGLFGRKSQFQAIMQSCGNSTLIILERDNLPSNIKHFGGDVGFFSYGIYCEHPKNRDILIPINNYNELIKTMILEETIRVYESLGAKEIIIEDITDLSIDSNTKVKSVKAKGDVKVKKEILRKKTFGKRDYKNSNVFKDIYFIFDYPTIMSVVNARINGNQLEEEFTEIININVGLDIDVVSLFRNENDFKYERKWHFKVKFYDKNE